MSDLHLDAGHGAWDNGAQANGFVEKVLNLEATLYQEQRFKELGIDVSLTRRNDVGYSSIPRTNLVKKSGAKICLSNHFNADMGKGAGCETIHSIYSNGKLAKMIAAELNKAGQPLRRVFSRRGNNGDYYYMHRLTGSVETIIVEYAFLDNSGDASRIRSKEYRYKLYEAVVKATSEYMGIKYVGPKGEKGKAAPKRQTASHQIETATTLIKSGGFDNYKLVAKVDDLRFYDHPSWEDTDLIGWMQEGWHFPTVLAKYKVDDGYQYKVKNSDGEIFYITAAEEFVQLERKNAPTKEYVVLPSNNKTWRTYRLNVPPQKKYSDWSLTPARYGGLTYEVLGRPYQHVVTINTSRGKRNIYVGPDTNAKFIRK